MRFFILDDHPQVVRMLENIVEDCGLGQVIGSATDPHEGLDRILALRPDILIVDFLMPELDGPQVVAQVKAAIPQCQCIMLSQVSAKNLIEKAYQAGVSFFISKPINQLEVTRVVRQVSDQLMMAQKFAVLKSLLAQDLPQAPPVHKEYNRLEEVKRVMAKVGILGESGADDILRVCQYYLETGSTSSQVKVNEVCALVCDQPNAMEQRLRRAINKGLVNLANLGIEDYMNDVFVQYASSLYDFESVRTQMDCIRGKRSSGGKINVRKFIENLLLIQD